MHRAYPIPLQQKLQKCSNVIKESRKARKNKNPAWGFLFLRAFRRTLLLDSNFRVRLLVAVLLEITAFLLVLNDDNFFVSSLLFK